MYKSPIDIIYGQLETQVEGEVMKAVQKIAVNVDKDELIRALQYDRGQYQKGYLDAQQKCCVARIVTVFSLKQMIDPCVLAGDLIVTRTAGATKEKGERENESGNDCKHHHNGNICDMRYLCCGSLQ